MADTASLIARVKTDGADTAAKQLDDFASSAGRADKASDSLGKTTATAQPKLKGFGTGAQQVGYQVQDMIVQIQGGTSAFVALGQQGSQLAGAFGPGGAVVGAIIALGAAVGGTLYKTLGQAKVSAEELAAASKSVDAVFDRNKQGALELSDAYLTTANSAQSLIEKQAQISSALTGVNTIYAAASQNLKDVNEASFLWSGNLDGLAASLKQGAAGQEQANRFYEDAADKYGLNREEVVKLTNAQIELKKSQTPENAQRLLAVATELAKAHGSENTALATLIDTTLAYTKAARDKEAADKSGASAVNSHTEALRKQNDMLIRNVQIGNLADKERIRAQAEADKKAFAEREGVTAEQIKQFNTAKDEEARQDIARVTDTENRKAKAEQDAINRRQESLASAAARKDASEKQQAQNFLDTIARQNQDELKAIDAQEQQKLSKLEEYRKQGAVTQQEYEQAKTQIAVDAETRRQEEIAKQQKKQDDVNLKLDTFAATIAAQNATELEQIDIQTQEKLKRLDEYYANAKDKEAEYQQARKNITEAAEKKKNDISLKYLSEGTDNLKTALGEGNALYKAAAITETVINTYKAATAAYSALAPIPIVGPALGVAAAAAATAAGLATVGKIRSAREQGGNLAAGQISTIAERNSPEVIMPAGASRVRTAQQMRQIMGDNGSAGNSVPNISIVNNTQGRVDNVQTQMDEGRLRIIINEQMINQTQDSNSGFSKARRATRNQPGFS